MAMSLTDVRVNVELAKGVVIDAIRAGKRPQPMVFDLMRLMAQREVAESINRAKPVSMVRLENARAFLAVHSIDEAFRNAYGFVQDAREEVQGVIARAASMSKFINARAA